MSISLGWKYTLISFLHFQILFNGNYVAECQWSIKIIMCYLKQINRLVSSHIAVLACFHVTLNISDLKREANIKWGQSWFDYFTTPQYTKVTNKHHMMVSDFARIQKDFKEKGQPFLFSWAFRNFLWVWIVTVS